jgi:hypothetical protein
MFRDCMLLCAEIAYWIYFSAGKLFMNSFISLYPVHDYKTSTTITVIQMEVGVFIYEVLRL